MEAFTRSRAETRATRERLMTARLRARDLLAQESFDPTALTAALAEARAATADLQIFTHGVITAAAPQLSVEARRKLADVVRAP